MFSSSYVPDYLAQMHLKADSIKERSGKAGINLWKPFTGYTNHFGKALGNLSCF